MTRTSFGFGTPIQPEFLNAVAYPKITGLPEDGHLDLLTNANFLDQPGTIVYDYYEGINRLKSDRFGIAGLTITVNGFTMLGPLGDLITVPTQNVNVPDNSVSWVWFDGVGAIQVTSFNPPAGVRSSRVTSGSGQITQIVDLRHDRMWIPNPATLTVFGGNSTVDYTAPNGVTVLSGTLNCRNFIVPTGAIIEVDRSLTVRASGVCTISGTIRTRVNPVAFSGHIRPDLGLDNGVQQTITGSGYSIDLNGVPVTNRNKAQAYGGITVAQVQASTANTGRATICTFNLQQGSSSLTLGNGTSGAILTINSAGPVTVNSTAVINCSATSSTTPAFTNAVFSVVGGGTTNAVTDNWTVQVNILPAFATAGTIAIQSSTSILVNAGASIEARGANKVSGLVYRAVSTALAAPVFSSEPFLTIGGGGGGAIHFQAPTVSSSPSATILTTAGSHTIVGGESYLNGPGSGGNGFNASTNALPTNGPITTVLAAPIEF
jgi:hypothetical protein